MHVTADLVITENQLQFFGFRQGSSAISFFVRSSAPVSLSPQRLIRIVQCKVPAGRSLIPTFFSVP
jgi:hypothetical protein